MTSPPSPATFVSRKFDGSPHKRVDGWWLGENEFGTWFAVTAGTVTRTPAGGFVNRVGYVQLFPHSGWWAAMFLGPDADVEVYCDVCTPPGRDGDTVRIVDLDLDVIRDHDGTVRLDDEDEFAAHRVRYGYPDEVIGEARRSARALQEALAPADGREPFRTAYRPWCDELSALLPSRTRSPMSRGTSEYSTRSTRPA